MENFTDFLKKLGKRYLRRIIIVVVAIALVIVLLSSFAYYLKLLDGSYDDGNDSNAPYVVSTMVDNVEISSARRYEFRDVCTRIMGRANK